MIREHRPIGGTVVPDAGTFDVADVPSSIDRGFPALFVGLGLLAAMGVVVDGRGEHVWVAVVLVAISVSPWALALAGVRLPDPLFVTVVVAPIAVVVVLGDPLGVLDLDEGWPQLVMMLLVGIAGQVGATGSRRLLAGTTASVLGVVVAGAIARGQPLDYTAWIVGIVLGVGGGRAFRANAIHVSELRRTHEALARQQLADERRRIAREVHDIVAHTMSVTMLHLTAARLALPADPSSAEEALAEAERQGRASMDEIRGVVRLLRTDEEAVVPALPDSGDIAALVDRYVTAGTAVEIEVAGALAGLPGAHRLAVYRVLQESLTNAVRHGCEPVRVQLDTADGAVALEVVNGLRADIEPSPTPGAGIAGMRERVEALDGTFTAAADGVRWVVRARIPA